MIRQSFLAAAGMVFAVSSVAADVLAIGSTAHGGTSQIGRALSAVVSASSPHQMRPQEVANTADYIPLVNAGELDFGIANVVQTYHALNGEGMSAGRPNENIVMAATLMPFRAGIIVPADSDIKTLADLKGKRVPSFSEGTLGYHAVNAHLANAGLSEEDIVPVPVPNFPRMWASFRDGTTDAAVVVLGAANTREFDAVMGGIRYLELDTSPEALDRMKTWLPQMYVSEIGPEAQIPGLTKPTNIMTYDYTLFASTATDEDHVYDVVKALYEGEDSLLATGPFFADFDGDNMGKDVKIPYHPGAIRFYEEKGIWNR